MHDRKVIGMIRMLECSMYGSYVRLKSITRKRRLQSQVVRTRLMYDCGCQIWIRFELQSNPLGRQAPPPWRRRQSPRRNIIAGQEEQKHYNGRPKRFLPVATASSKLSLIEMRKEKEGCERRKRPRCSLEGTNSRKTTTSRRF